MTTVLSLLPSSSCRAFFVFSTDSFTSSTDLLRKSAYLNATDASKVVALGRPGAGVKAGSGEGLLRGDGAGKAQERPESSSELDPGDEGDGAEKDQERPEFACESEPADEGDGAEKGQERPESAFESDPADEGDGSDPADEGAGAKLVSETGCGAGVRVVGQPPMLVTGDVSPWSLMSHATFAPAFKQVGLPPSAQHHVSPLHMSRA